MHQPIEMIFGAWNIGRILEIRIPATGTISQTFLAATDQGRYVLRAYRTSSRHVVGREHALIAYVASQQLPAIAPVALPSGATILAYRQRPYVLSPHAPGVQLIPLPPAPDCHHRPMPLPCAG